jgi:spermidine synthase
VTYFIFGLTIFNGSFLLFLIQPMVGKILLPCLGGSPSVWTTCMLFFQAVLLAGYLYAEKAIKYLGCEKQSVLHALLMITAFVFLPLSVDFTGLNSAFASPVSWLIARLLASIGFLFFIIAANAPIIQRWYANTGAANAEDPYFLYSASNAGSLLALLSYPFLIEPNFSLTDQKLIWSGLYIIQAVLVSFCAVSFWGKTPETTNKLKADFYRHDRVGMKNAAAWVLWGFIPCSAMLAVTTHIATDIASIPLLWVVPLSIYLLSFILVFALKDFYRTIPWDRFMLPMAVLVSLMYYFGLNERAWYSISLHLLFLFFVCMSFHSRLALDRPAVHHLNSFYVYMSVGGILGGIFNGIVAPMAFNSQIEYILTILLTVIAACFAQKYRDKDASVFQEILAIVLTLFALMVFAWFSAMTSDKFFNAIGLLAIFSVVFMIHFFYRFKRFAAIAFLLASLFSLNHKVFSDSTIFVDRSFFGIIKVLSLRTEENVDYQDLNVIGEKDMFYCLSHGTTLHGVERKIKIRPIFPLSYYSREGPVGDIFSAALIKRWAKKIGVVGLGCGTMAWYGRKWQSYDFFEIDPLVVDIATNPDYFTYIKNSKAEINLVTGDARIKLEQVKDNTYDILVLDAYSSDAVPVHLLTVEAFKLYLRKLKPDGVLVLHLSNRFFKLGYIVARIFAELDIEGIERRDDPKDYSIKYDWYDMPRISKSYWVAGSKKNARLKLIGRFGNWKTLESQSDYSLWTDDYANLLQVYNWR